MRYVGLLSALVTPFFFFGIAEATSATLAIPLRLGNEHEDVRALQKFLNMDPDTRVAQEGVGAPGQETPYFGPRTLDAVKRFQEKYKNEILFPLGLPSPTGFVGAATLKKIREIQMDLGKRASESGSSVGADLPSAQTFQKPATRPIPLTANMQIHMGVHPNSINLEYSLAAIKTLAQKEGRSEAEVAALEDAVRAEVATTTDFRKEFFKAWNLGAAPQSPFSGIKDRVLNLFAFFGVASRAYAQGNTPFGGELYYAFPCNCSGNWLLTIEPLPPTHVGLLTYRQGTQKYESYNIPNTQYLLGFYSEGGSCRVVSGKSCATIPSEGSITPTVGSSP